MTDRRNGEALRCMRAPRPVRWTRQRRKQFLTALAETSNVSASARAAGMNRCSAYALKDRDPEFAKSWKAALEQGYAELETHLMRHAIEGAVRTEKVIDGETQRVKQIKVVHSYPLTVAVRLLNAHRLEVEAWRRNGSTGDAEEDALSDVDKLNDHLERIRERLLANENQMGDIEAESEGE
jgi:hypothetical protein